MAEKEFDNTNRGVLFINNRKESEKHPDYTGNVNIDGVGYWLSGWKKVGKSGTFLSLAVKPKEVKDGFLDQKPTKTSDGVGGSIDTTDDIPF